MDNDQVIARHDQEVGNAKAHGSSGGLTRAAWHRPVVQQLGVSDATAGGTIQSPVEDSPFAPS